RRIERDLARASERELVEPVAEPVEQHRGGDLAGLVDRELHADVALDAELLRFRGVVLAERDVVVVALRLRGDLDRRDRDRLGDVAGAVAAARAGAGTAAARAAAVRA